MTVQRLVEVLGTDTPRIHAVQQSHGQRGRRREAGVGADLRQVRQHHCHGHRRGITAGAVRKQVLDAAQQGDDPCALSRV
jgi:hypothetical protein